MTNLNLTQFPVYLEIPNINDVLHLDVKHKIARLEDTKASMDWTYDCSPVPSMNYSAKTWDLHHFHPAVDKRNPSFQYVELEHVITLGQRRYGLIGLMDERVLVLGDQHPGDKEYHLFGYGQGRIWNILPLPMIDPQSQQVMLIEKLGMTHPQTQGAFCDRYNQLQF